MRGRHRARCTAADGLRFAAALPTGTHAPHRFSAAARRGHLPRLDYPGGLVGRWPQSYQRPDELVLDDLIKGLAASNEIDATAIEISCERGVIKASRSVETRAEQLVLEALSVSTIGAVDYDADVVVSKA